MAEARYGSLPFAEAIRFFRSKVQVPSRRWADVWRDQHDVGFMVAGAYKAELLDDLRVSVDKAIAAGTTLQQFRNDFDAIVTRHGWQYRGNRNWRTRIIYETNLRTAYQAGRYAQLTDPDLLSVRPYWRYKHSEAVQHPRPLHLSWDGLIIRADDPWWKAHYPPGGWGCKCRVFAAGERELRKAGKTGPDIPPDDGTYEWVDKATGEVHTIPRGIDPGWDYAPGASQAQRIRDEIQRKIRQLPTPLADALRRDIADPTPPPPLPITPEGWDPNTPTGRWHEATFKSGPDWLISAVARAGVADVIERKGSESYHQLGTIVIGRAMDDSHGQAVWRHEFGHFMDFKRRRNVPHRSSESDFTEAMEADGDVLKKGSGLGRRSRAQQTRIGANRQASAAIVGEMRDLGAAERRARLEALADDAGVDYKQLDGWLSEHGLIGTLEQGVSRDALTARALVAWERGDAQGFLDAIEGVTPDQSGALTTQDFRNRIVAFTRGSAGMLSDLLSAATNKSVEGSGSHSASYYRERQGWGRQAESWANITDLANSEFGRLILERFTPEMYRVFRSAP